MDRLGRRKRSSGGVEESQPEAKRASLSQPSAATGGCEDVEFFVLDVEEDKSRQALVLHGIDASSGKSLCVRVEDFSQYCYIHAPASSLSEQGLEDFRTALAATKDGAEVASVSLVSRLPVVYYRARSPGPSAFLKLVGVPGVRASKLAKLASAALGQDVLAYEDNVKPLNRFLVDTGLCGGGWARVQNARVCSADERVSRSDVELFASAHSFTALTPDAVQLSDPAHAAEHATRPMPHLKLMLLDCQLMLAPPSSAVAKGKKAVLAAAAAAALPKDRTPNAARGDPIMMLSCVMAPVPPSGGALQPTSRLVFTWPRTHAAAPPGTRLRAFDSEREMLTAFASWVVSEEADPDIIGAYQVKQSFGALVMRAEALRIPMRLGRDLARPLSIKSVVQYSPSWVKSAGRMAATSNQETFRVNIGGRVVLDVLRQVLTSHSLGTFTLADCSLSLLQQPLEVLLPADIAALWADGAAGWSRMARYSLKRACVVGDLMARLNSVGEVVEMARATGLTLGAVSYQAQLVRTHSLLLRLGRRAGYVIGGALDGGLTTQPPFLIHPVAAKTAGMYDAPVAVLDLASSYPSIFIARNLCPSTMVHPQDQPGFVDASGTASGLTEDDVFRCAGTGSVFVKEHIRKGVFPELLTALLAARALAREALAAAKREGHAELVATLELRQKSLKLAANAAYGFIGAGASPLQCLPVADACLGLGALACRTAIVAVESCPDLAGCRVIYGQTDSLFFLMPQGTSTAQAFQLGQRAATVATEALPRPMRMQLERVFSRLLLLHVNRYAGCQLAVPSSSGELLIKGLKSAWRQSAPFVRRLLTTCLHLLLVECDLERSLLHAASEIRRLLSGEVDLGELIMTGGLWRLTRSDISSAVMAEVGEAEVRGPHAALAVRLQKEDPGREFVLGERVPYVLLAGHKQNQMESAEDPVAALHTRAQPDLLLYWHNKVRTPLEEMFVHVASKQQMAELLGGAHTRVSVAASAAAAPSRGAFGTFAPLARCLSCRQTVARSTGSPPAALCASCLAVPDRERDELLRHTAALVHAEARKSACDAAHASCHSGGLVQPLLCACADCPVLFAGAKADADVDAAREALRRFGW